MTLLVLWYAFVFLIGICVGSYLNVCTGRLPYEKSVLWPGSHCLSCYQPIRWFDNVPIVSYLVLRGRCRTCRSRVSPRYLLVEVGTGLAFVGLFHFEVIANCLRMPMFERAAVEPGMPPLPALPVYLHHVILLSFLIGASVCDLMEMEIPFSMTMTGTLVGLVMSMLLPWPSPEVLPDLRAGFDPFFPPVRGAYAWPVWYPLPEWLPPHSWKVGLATGVAGALAGMILLRGVRFLFALGRGIEGLGVGDADLMMMAGAFVGWQPVILAFFVSVFPALLFAMVQLILKGNHPLPFGPSLSLGVVLTVLFWPTLGMHFQQLFFSAEFLAILVVAAAIALLSVSFLLRLMR